jgi:hypothetical protein
MLNNNILVTANAGRSANFLVRLLQFSPDVYFQDSNDYNMRFSEIFEPENFMTSKVIAHSNINFEDLSESLKDHYLDRVRPDIANEIDPETNTINASPPVSVNDILYFEKMLEQEKGNVKHVYFTHAQHIYKDDNIDFLLQDNRYLVHVYLDKESFTNLQIIKLIIDRQWFHLTEHIDEEHTKDVRPEELERSARRDEEVLSELYGQKKETREWLFYKQRDYVKLLTIILWDCLRWIRDCSFRDFPNPDYLSIVEERKNKIIEFPMSHIIDANKVHNLTTRLGLNIDIKLLQKYINAYIMLNKYYDYPLLSANILDTTKLCEGLFYNSGRLGQYFDDMKDTVKNKELITELISQHFGHAGVHYPEYINIYKMIAKILKLVIERNSETNGAFVHGLYSQEIVHTFLMDNFAKEIAINKQIIKEL